MCEALCGEWCLGGLFGDLDENESDHGDDDLQADGVFAATYESGKIEILFDVSKTPPRDGNAEDEEAG